MISKDPYTYPYVLNNPLRFVDPSGYRPVGIFEEEALMNQNGGGNNSSWNPFGWINNAPTGWTDFTGPNLGQWHYWNDNVSGNPLYGESADEFTAWYREMRYGDQKTEDWGNAIDYGLNYSSYDVTTLNRAGVSGYNLDFNISHADYLLFGMKVNMGNFDYLYSLLASNNGDKDGIDPGRLQFLWNCGFIRSKIPDRLSISLEVNVAVFIGAGQNIELNWITRGKDARILPYVTNTTTRRYGFEGDAGIQFNKYWYNGQPSEISENFLYGPNRSIDGGLGVGGGVSQGLSEDGSLLWIGGGTGFGMTIGFSYGIGFTSPWLTGHPKF